VNVRRKKIAAEATLTDLVALDILQGVQDWFAETSGISVVVRDMKGDRITAPNYQNPFCEMVMESPPGEKACRTSCARAIKSAARRHALAKTTTRAQLLQFVAPIFVEDVCLGGMVMGGRPEHPLTRRQVNVLARACDIPREEIDAALAQTPDWSENELVRSKVLVESAANTVGWLCIQGAKLRGKMQEIESLFETSRILAATLDLRKVLKLVARSAVEVLGAKGCSIRLLGPRRQRLEIKSYYNLSRRYLNKGVVTLEKCPIDQAALTGEIVQMPDMVNDARVLYPKEAEREGIRSGLSVGLISKRQPVGTLHVYRAEHGRFDESEVQLLMALANHAAVAIDNAQLYQQAAQGKKMQRELRVAGEIQAQLLPERAPEIAGADIAILSEPCHEVGGDFLDFVKLDNRQTAFIIADVAGKGVPAALLMASARATARAYLERTSQPRTAVGRLNVALCHDARPGHFVSLFCGVLDSRQRSFAYTNAGHNPPLLVRKGKVIHLDAGGLVLGVDDEEKYEQDSIKLRKGDLLVFYTDGVTEALDAAGEIFGEERLVKLLTRGRHDSAHAVARKISNAIKRHAKGEEQSDDITMIVMRVI